MIKLIPDTRSQSQSQRLWLLSFGDLLTLCLCTFIALATNSLQSKREENQIFPGVREGKGEFNQEVGENYKASGIPLAQIPRRESVLGRGKNILFLSRSDLRPRKVGLTSRGQVKINRFIAKNKGEKFSLEGCKRKGHGQKDQGQTNRASSFLVSLPRLIGRVVAIKSYLLSQNIWPERLRWRIGGSTCETNGRHPLASIEVGF